MLLHVHTCIYVCLSGLRLGGLLCLSFFFKLVCYAHVFPHIHVYMYGKVTTLGVLCCFALFVCLTLLASFFLPSHLSFKNMYMYIVHVHVCMTLLASFFILLTCTVPEPHSDQSCIVHVGSVTLQAWRWVHRESCSPVLHSGSGQSGGEGAGSGRTSLGGRSARCQSE